MKDQEREALTYPLRHLGAELERCSPELRTLVAMACGFTGAHPQERHARLRLGEAVTHWQPAQRRAARARQRVRLIDAPA